MERIAVSVCNVQRVNVLGIPISVSAFNPVDECASALESGHPMLVSFVNPHSCYMAKRHPGYIQQLKNLDWVLCDGIGMVKAAAKINKKAIERAAFDLTSIAGPVLTWSARASVPVVLVGGKPGVSEQAANRFRALVPEIQIAATYSGFDSDPEHAVEYLVEHPGTMVICGMGAPRQEAFLLDAKAAGWRGIGFTCGGFFDQVAQRVDYYPDWIDRNNLRFLYRLLKEPRRLWRRYLIEYQTFVKRYCMERLKR